MRGEGLKVGGRVGLGLTLNLLRFRWSCSQGSLLGSSLRGEEVSLLGLDLERGLCPCFWKGWRLVAKRRV